MQTKNTKPLPRLWDFNSHNLSAMTTIVWVVSRLSEQSHGIYNTNAGDQFQALKFWSSCLDPRADIELMSEVERHQCI